MLPADRSLFACIGWGSLVWKPGTLPCVGSWRSDGPELPVEFARESGVQGKGSRGDRITLVICPDGRRVPTFWVPLDVPNLAEARRVLAVREYEKADAKWTEANVGYWDAASRHSYGLEADTIAQWAKSQDLAAVVWTNLPWGFAGSRGVMPAEGDVLTFLRSLGDWANAEEYVRKTPVQIQTRYRQAIETQLGWTA